MAAHWKAILPKEKRPSVDNIKKVLARAVRRRLEDGSKENIAKAKEIFREIQIVSGRSDGWQYKAWTKMKELMKHYGLIGDAKKEIIVIDD
jgi:hypothetical protein